MNARCPDCGTIPETIKVSSGQYAYFVICQAETHRKREGSPGIALYGKTLSDGHPAPGPAEAQWAKESNDRQFNGRG